MDVDPETFLPAGTAASSSSVLEDIPADFSRSGASGLPGELWPGEATWMSVACLVHLQSVSPYPAFPLIIVHLAVSF